jgi:hypothetical protein
MAEEKKRSDALLNLNITVVALVALVAIVGLTAIVLNGAPTHIASPQPGTVGVSSGSNAAGQAYYSIDGSICRRVCFGEFGNYTGNRSCRIICS